jgi:hypothetical protein
MTLRTLEFGHLEAPVEKVQEGTVREVRGVTFLFPSLVPSCGGSLEEWPASLTGWVMQFLRDARLPCWSS